MFIFIYLEYVSHIGMESSMVDVLFSIRVIFYHLGETIMELIVSAGADHDLQVRFEIL